MKNQITKEQSEAIEAAKNEGKIFGKDLLAEILPLIEGYFTGAIKCGEGGIEFNFLNGQKFVLTVTEIQS